MTRRPPSTPSSPPAPSEGAVDLARLLETETRLEEMLRRARDEAAGLVTAARDATTAREATLAADLDALGQQLEATIAEERHRQEQEVAEAARREALRFDQISAEQVEVLARYVVDRVIGVDP